MSGRSISPPASLTTRHSPIYPSSARVLRLPNEPRRLTGLTDNVRHGRTRRRPVPVLLTRREPDHVAGVHLHDRAALPLAPAAAGRDDEGLAQRVGVPRRPGPGLERDAVAGRT